MSLLTPYRETIEHGTNYTRPPPDLIEDAEEYEVETIVNHCHFGRKRQLQYLIKWKGYPDADNTWESADHVHQQNVKVLNLSYSAYRKIILNCS